MPASLKLRLVVVSLLWITIGVVLAGLILSATFHEHLVQQLELDLAVDVGELQRVAVPAAGGTFELAHPLSDPRYATPNSGRFWAVLEDGKIVAKSPYLPPWTAHSITSPITAPNVSPTAPTDRVRFRSQEAAEGTLFISERSVADRPQRLTYLVGSDRQSMEQSMRRFNATITSAMGLFGASMIGAAVLLLLYAMAPLTKVQRALSDVRAGRTQRLSGSYPSEVRPLVDDLNAMMEAMGTMTQKARAQAGNLAHSLKTPLAVMTDEAYTVEKGGLKPSAAVMFEQCRRMQRHIDYQLASARAAAQRTMPGTSARALDVVNGVTSALSRLYSASPVVIEKRIPADLVVACDFQDLNEIVANVLDNALKNARSRVVITGQSMAGRAGTEARLEARSGAAHTETAEIVVEDDGPGLPPEAWDVVFDIGERWDSRAKGTGLGLPIVRDLAQLYGGSVVLGRSDLGGLRIAITLPAPQSPQ